MREDAKRIRIEVIKQQILHKLRLTAIPNITLANRPRLPPILSHLVDEFGGRTGHAHATADDVTNDEANHGDDDYHATTTKVIKFGEKRKKNKRARKEASMEGRKQLTVGPWLVKLGGNRTGISILYNSLYVDTFIKDKCKTKYT
jgi:hypothetical protein